MSYCAFCGEDRDWCTCNVEPHGVREGSDQGAIVNEW